LPHQEQFILPYTETAMLEVSKLPLGSHKLKL